MTGSASCRSSCASPGSLRHDVGHRRHGRISPGRLWTLLVQRRIAGARLCRARTDCSRWLPTSRATYKSKDRLELVGAADSMVDTMVRLGAIPDRFGLAITGLLAALAEIELLLGSAIAPLILPAIAFGPTAQLGFGAVSFLVSAASDGSSSWAHVACHGAGGDGARLRFGGKDTALTHPQIIGAVPVGHALCCRWRSRTNGIARTSGWRSGWHLGLGSVQSHDRMSQLGLSTWAAHRSGQRPKGWPVYVAIVRRQSVRLVAVSLL